MPRICSVLPSGGQKLSGTGRAYLVPVLLCAPSRRLVLVVKCEPQPPTPLLKKAAKVRGWWSEATKRRLCDGEADFEEERGKKKRGGGETESYSKSETEKEGQWGGGVSSKKVCYRSIRTKEKVFSLLHRDRLFDLNQLLQTSEGLRRKPSRCSQPTGDSGWISGKVLSKCNVKQDGIFPWQHNLTVAINCLAH